METIIKLILETSNIDETKLLKIFRKNPKKKGALYKKSELLEYYKLNSKKYSLSFEKEKYLLSVLQKKTTRTISGVTPVTVLTMPHPCMGRCIFCPTDVSMPKSYLKSEPGAQRAFFNKFDPYYQTFNRIAALSNIGHPTDKIELIILGGTWTNYSENYRKWFIKRCFDGMNEFDSSKNSHPITPVEFGINETLWKDVFNSQKINEKALSRCVGLAVETRPDEINLKNLIDFRKLGVTKVQLGVQSLDNKVLKLNKRGHTIAQTKKAFELLRQMGFKIHIHYMPNLLGSSPANDVKDYKKLFTGTKYQPDEIKIYPCSLIQSAELMNYYKKGLWKPYSEKSLLGVLTQCVVNTPRYCRITRMIRDIPSNEIYSGNKKTNFRQNVEENAALNKYTIKEIRSREIKDKTVNLRDLNYKKNTYKTAVSKEIFLEYVTEQDEIAAFLRLSLPLKKELVSELKDCSIIREIHVYGRSLQIGEVQKGKAQHMGLGKKLINEAIQISKDNRYKKVAVISSIGTREYYRKNGFTDGNLYQTCKV